MMFPIEGLAYMNAPVAPTEPRSPRRVMEDNCRVWHRLEREIPGEPPESSVQPAGPIDEPVQ